MTKSAKSSPVVMGCQIPSERVAPEYKITDGGDAIKLLRVGGLILDEWQADILFDWMGKTVGNKWASTTCGGSVPRQNGKSLLVQGRAEAGMLLYNEQVIYTAHLQKTATETFEEMATFFDSNKLKKYVKDIKTALGREQIILKSGARVKFLARTRNGGRGQHGDLLIIDEAQELDENQQASFLPAISASLNPQTIYVGTPPDPSAVGTVFRNIRQKALDKSSKKTSWFEFSVEKIGDVTDKERWAQTNPALGRRMLLSTIEGECDQMDADTFARERLGWWSPIVTQTVDYAINREAWDACKSDAMKPEGKTAYGVKFSPDGSMVALSGAVMDESGQIRISLIEMKNTGQGTQWLASWLNERYNKACCVVIDGRNGVDVLIDKIKDVWVAKNSVIKPGMKDVVAAVGMLTDAINEKTLTWYGKQEVLNDSAITSTKRSIGGGWGFGGENSAPIESCSLALWAVKTSKRNPAKKMRIG